MALTWSNRIEPKRRVLLNAMVPQVLRMVTSEDPAKVATFIAKTMGLCAYILEGDGAVLKVPAYAMPREDESADSDGSDQLRADIAPGAGEGPAVGGDGDGQDDAGGDADLLVLQSLPELSDLDPGQQAEIPS